MSAKKASEQLTRIAVLQNLDSVLAEFGLDAGVELGKLDMDVEMLRDGDLLIHLNRAVEILEHCAKATHCPDFSLRLAAAQDVSFLGVLALFLQTSASLGEALEEISQYNHVHHTQPVTWRVQDFGNVVTFNFHLDAAGLSPLQHRLAVDLGLAHAFNVIDSLSGGRIRPQRVLMRSDRSKEAQSYKRFFRAPVEFNAEMDGLLLPAGCLDFPLLHPDSRMHEAVRQQISPIESDTGASPLISEVRTIIRSLLPTGNSSLDRVAKCYSCDKRTLQRHLMEEGDTTYQALLDEVRFDLVQQYLCDSHMPMTQITYAAGFTDPSNFARAFRKRFGVPPRQWREQHKPGKSPLRTSNLKLHKIGV